MKMMIKTLAVAAALALTAGSAMAADQAMKDCCCCKDKDGKMSCCDDMKKPDGQAQHPAPQHQH